MSKVALITGITGQDGSFLAEFLIEKGYEVHGILRRSSSFNTARIEHLYLDEWVRDMKKSRLINLHWGDMTDSSSLIRIISHIRPDEIYNLAAQSHVKVSFDVPEYTAEADAVGTLRLLEAVRICGLEKSCRIYQASTSELYGKVQEAKPVFAVVEPATVPLQPSGTSRKMILIGVVFLAVAAAAAWVLFGQDLLKTLKEKMAEEKSETKE